MQLKNLGPLPDEAEVNRMIGAKLKEIKQKKSLRNAEMSFLSGVSEEQYRRYETGANRISAAKVTVLATALREPPGDFIDVIKIQPDQSAAPEESKRMDEALKAFFAIQSPELRKAVLYEFESLINEHSPSYPAKFSK